MQKPEEYLEMTVETTIFRDDFNNYYNTNQPEGLDNCKNIDPGLVSLLEYNKQVYMQGQVVKNIFPGLHGEFVELYEKTRYVLAQENLNEMNFLRTRLRSLNLGLSPRTSQGQVVKNIFPGLHREFVELYEKTECVFAQEKSNKINFPMTKPRSLNLGLSPQTPPAKKQVESPVVLERFKIRTIENGNSSGGQQGSKQSTSGSGDKNKSSGSK